MFWGILYHLFKKYLMGQKIIILQVSIYYITRFCKIKKI